MTFFLAILFLVLIIGTDIWLLKSKKYVTYSRMIADYADAHFFFRLIMEVSIGILIGHWLWPVHICL